MSYINKNTFLNDLPFKDNSKTLISESFPDCLPPIINIFTEKSVTELMKFMFSINEKTNKLNSESIFLYDKQEDLFKKFKNSITCAPYIHGNNWAAESIKFFHFKKNNSLRGMAIPNIKHSLLFACNTLIIHKSLRSIYLMKPNELGNSQSPILDSNNTFNNFLYDQKLNIRDKFINNDSNSFKFNLYKKYERESSAPYILTVDLNNFFDNIYTHLFDDKNIFKEIFIATNFKEYVHWLDNFNQKINDNHTKGILQGPISSKISAEILQMSIDFKINKLIKNKHITFNRYVDDYTFYGYSLSSLESLKEELIKMFRNYSLSVNESKLDIYKGFSNPVTSNLKKESLINLKIIDIDNFIYLRTLIGNFVDNDDIPSTKSILTRLSNLIKSKNLSFENNDILLTFVSMLIKISYLKPTLSINVFKLIKEILIYVNDNPSTVDEICESIFEELKYINNNYSDTVLMVWAYHLIGEFSNNELSSKSYAKYKEKYYEGYYNDDGEDYIIRLNPLILSSLCSTKNVDLTADIQKDIIKIINILNKKYFQNGTKKPKKAASYISQTRWWIVLAKIRIVLGDKIDRRLKKLFRKKNTNEYSLENLGIIDFLTDHL